MEGATNSQQKFDDVAKLLSTKKNIIVLAGAGISGKSALVLFHLMNECVQCEVSMVGVLHLTLVCLYVSSFVCLCKLYVLTQSYYCLFSSYIFQFRVVYQILDLKKGVSFM